MKELEKLLKAFANRRRLAIIKYLKSHKEASVSEVAYEISLSFKATSKHLLVLLAVDIVEREQRNVQMFYQLANPQKSIVRQIIGVL